MDANEVFAKILSLWSNSFKPQDNWRPLVIEELETWTPTERSNVVATLLGMMGKNKTVDLATLRSARGAGGSGRKTLAISNEEDFLSRLGILEAFQRQQVGDRVMISRLIRTMMFNPGWDALLEEQAGDPSVFKEWERVENLLRASDKAMTMTPDGRGRKTCYPASERGWEAPAGASEVVLPPAPSKSNRNDQIEGMNLITAVIAKVGGFRLMNCSGIYNSADYKRYLLEYTDRTGLLPG